MKSAIAIITYNRLHALKETLSGIQKFCSQYPVAIFEDCGQRDGTEAFLKPPNQIGKYYSELLATHYAADHLGSNIDVFLGDTNLGVTGNSNRAIKWFSSLNQA